MQLLPVFFCLCALTQAASIERQPRAVTSSPPPLPALHVCHGPLGCFSPRPGFQRLPESPEKINVQFFLSNRANNASAELISATNLGSLAAAKPIKFIIHGFTDKTSAPWVSDMTRELLLFGDYDVIAVDWSGGNQFPYGQAVANTVTTAAVIVQLIRVMIDVGARPDQVHLIGHSLGAHISSYVGQNVPGLGRISGLDPAGPDFHNALEPDRLDPSDAAFVDVIHTDGAPRIQSGFGHMSALGHVDFYPNGGSTQPTCARGIGDMVGGALWTLLSTASIDSAVGAVACNHQAAILYYIDSINTRSPQNAYPCENFRSFTQGKCTRCDLVGNESCQQMGFHASLERQLGSLYLYTLHGSKAPHFGFHFMVTLESDTTNDGRTRGTIKLKLNNQELEESFLGQDVLLQRESVHAKTVLVPTNLGGALREVTVSFVKGRMNSFGLGMADKWSFKSISVVDMQNNANYKFCPMFNSNTNSSAIKSGSNSTFTSCL